VFGGALAQSDHKGLVQVSNGHGRHASLSFAVTDCSVVNDRSAPKRRGQ
jgi:hypothetical protein